MCVGRQSTAWHFNPISDSTYFNLSRSVKMECNANTTFKLIRKKYCFINPPVSGVSIADTSGRFAERVKLFDTFEPKGLTFTHQLLKACEVVEQSRGWLLSISFSGFSASG
jgi:hypothetical protein